MVKLETRVGVDTFSFQSDEPVTADELAALFQDWLQALHAPDTQLIKQAILDLNASTDALAAAEAANP